jgi:flagellar basal body rod protein FlgB
MGTILKGILGGFSGKVGTVIGGSWKGIDYMRARPSGNSNPMSAAQLEQRAKFMLIVRFQHPLTAFLRIGFKNQAIKMSGFNAATSYNLANAITGTYPAYEVDYSKVLVSQGTLPGALNPEVTSTTAGEIEYTWEDNSTDTDASATDKALLVVYNPLKKQAVTVVGGNTRTGGSQSITLPANFTGDEVQCFISFSTEKQSVLSNSGYVGGIIVL